MATSSITHNFVVTDAKRFLDAIDESERKCAEISANEGPRCRTVTDPAEIREIWKNMKAHAENSASR